MEYRKYAQIWNRYLPVIKILLKKSLQAEQVLNLDRSDFEKVGTARKAGYKFKIEFVKGRVGNIISGSELATDLANCMQDNEGVRTILGSNEFTIELNTKFQLKIACKNMVEPSVEPKEEVMSEKLIPENETHSEELSKEIESKSEPEPPAEAV